MKPWNCSARCPFSAHVCQEYWDQFLDAERASEASVAPGRRRFPGCMMMYKFKWSLTSFPAVVWTSGVGSVMYGLIS